MVVKCMARWASKREMVWWGYESDMTEIHLVFEIVGERGIYIIIIAMIVIMNGFFFSRTRTRVWLRLAWLDSVWFEGVNRLGNYLIIATA